MKLLGCSLILMLTMTYVKAQTFDDYFNKGKKAIELEKYSEAFQLLGKAIELNPKSDSAYFYRAQARIELSEYEQAILDCNKMIELNPSAEAFDFRGIVNASAKLYENASMEIGRAHV